MACGARSGDDCAYDYVSPPPSPPSLPLVALTDPECTLDYEWHGCSAKCDFGIVSERYKIDVWFTLHVDVQSATEGEFLLELGDGTEIVSFVITDGTYLKTLPIPLPVPGVSLSLDLGVTVGQTTTAMEIHNAMHMSAALTISALRIPLFSAPLGEQSFAYSCWNVPFLVGMPVVMVVLVMVASVCLKRRSVRGAAQALLEYQSHKAKGDAPGTELVAADDAHGGALVTTGDALADHV